MDIIWLLGDASLEKLRLGSRFTSGACHDRDCVFGCVGCKSAGEVMNSVDGFGMFWKLGESRL